MSSERRRHTLLVLSQGISAGGSLVLLLLTARLLGPDGRGQFAFFLLWPTLGAYLLALGLPGANLHRAARAPQEVPILIGNGFAFALGVGALTAIPLAIGPPTWMLGPMSHALGWTAWASMVLMLGFNAVAWTSMGRNSFVLPNMLKGAFPFLAGMALLVMIALGTSRTALLAGLLYAAAIGVVLVVATASALHGHSRLTLDRAVLRASLGYGIRFHVGLVGTSVSGRADQAVLGVAQPPSVLAVYSVAVSISEVASYGSTARGMTKFRDASRNVNSSARSIARIVTAETIVLGLFVAAAALLVPVVLGEDYREALGLTLVLLPGVVGMGLLRVCGSELAGRGHPQVVSRIAAAQALMMVAAYVVFIPHDGMWAAAVISSIGYLLGGAAAVYELDRRQSVTDVERPTRAESQVV